MCFNISIVSSVDAIEKQFNAEFHIDFSFEAKKHISAFINPKISPIHRISQKQYFQSITTAIHL
jgi:hypothetical protein